MPEDLKAKLDTDPWMHKCCITGSTTEKIDWHHNMIHAGRQVNEAFAILPLARSVHDRVPGDKELKDRLDWIMLNRATIEELMWYSRAINYIRRRDILNKKYGVPGSRNTEKHL